jgi:hypothetical protein
VQELRLTTPTGFEELRAFGFTPVEMLSYARALALENLRKWKAGGIEVDGSEGFTVGWLDGLLVGLALMESRRET